MTSTPRPTKPPAPRYDEGEFFAVPLCSGGWGIGMAARLSKSGRRGYKGMLGFGFGLKLDRPPVPEDVAGLTIHDVVCAKHMGDMGLGGGHYTLLGRPRDFSYDAWPFPLYRTPKPVIFCTPEMNDMRYPPVDLFPADQAVHGIMYWGVSQSNHLEWLIDLVITNPADFRRTPFTPERVACWRAAWTRLKAEGHLGPEDKY